MRNILGWIRYFAAKERAESEFRHVSITRDSRYWRAQRVRLYTRASHRNF